MAEQARSLSTMMERYKVSGGTGSVASLSTLGAQDAAQTERRSASRPWNGAAASAAGQPQKSGKVAAPAPALSRTGTHGAGAADWQEF